MCMNTSQSKGCAPLPPLPYSFTYVHAVAFLSRSHAPESGRGDDEATGNTKPSRKYFGGNGGSPQRDRDGSLQMDFLVLFAAEFHMVKFNRFEEPAKSTRSSTHVYRYTVGARR